MIVDDRESRHRYREGTYRFREGIYREDRDGDDKDNDRYLLRWGYF